ncbi:phosphoglycerate kinase [Shigella flexneri]
MRASLPTIELALKQGAKVMVTSHPGRPTEGEYNEKFSLLPVVDYLKTTVRPSTPGKRLPGWRGSRRR